ncbi:serine-threonine/tyrosine-protein kinase catalytic domain-containing protein [Artemisia annua]|uniref:Serine-threonine/tyrosine-protein kinase catalytic domain-containing protein n=1 Tax=Artemisia annua TaxID=35608 RepID=A0A2U1NC14_ARTAN|nr:serine-threonine/tyrosine-protein kinase catalytic domain-containing protein [Artemisia annua]
MSMVNERQHLKIPFHEIEVATENFKTLIGRGGYGSVFKGKLLVSGKETMVAVKRLNEQSGQGLKEFLTEIQSLSGQQHPNLISLVGFCNEGREMSIVYEYAERGSLDKYIRRTRKTTSTTLTWLQRLQICVDAARGLDHLHNHVGGHRTIIHRDIKSSNILIDENWVAKISDLGLSRLSVTGFGMSDIVSNGCGTQGYFEPEYSTTGILTKKSDVYSFGVVLFEVLCGRLCLNDSEDGFRLSSISAKYHYKKNSLDKIMDDSLREHIGSYSMNKFAAIAYRCLHDDREQRPAMDVVLKELEEALKFQWFSICKSTNGICSLLSSANKIYSLTTAIDISESRFGCAIKLEIFFRIFRWASKFSDLKFFHFKTKLESVMFSPQYTYACYLLFKFSDDNPRIPDNTVLFKTECKLDEVSMGKMISYRSTYPMNDYELHDLSNILEEEGLEENFDQMEDLGYTRIEERKDGWMEAMLFIPTNELQDQKNGCHLDICLTHSTNITGMIIEGIEFRPYI